MKKVLITVKATTATLNIGIGFRPDVVRVLNRTDFTGLYWSRDDITNRFGVTRAGAGDLAQAADAAHGLIVYAGGDKITAASTTYLLKNEADQRAVDVAAGSKATQFTIDTAANKTGHFNIDVVGATIGLGSKIYFDGDSAEYTITALTAGQGADSDEVTLDKSPGSGTKSVSRITSRWAYTGAASGKVIPEGFTLGASATVNDTDSDVLEIEAEQL